MSSTGGVGGGMTNGDGRRLGLRLLLLFRLQALGLAPGLLGLFLQASLPRGFIGGRFRLLAFGVLFRLELPLTFGLRLFERFDLLEFALQYDGRETVANGLTSTSRNGTPATVVHASPMAGGAPVHSAGDPRAVKDPRASRDNDLRSNVTVPAI